MKHDFEKLYEAANNTLKTTKVMRYPRQIQLSEEFMEALNKEVSRHVDVIDEAQGPIRHFPDKFLKALKFELSEITEAKKQKQKQQVKDMPEQLKARPRQKWDIDPRTRVHQKGGKTPRDQYDRKRDKREWKKEADSG
jgi:hypothetical protein